MAVRDFFRFATDPESPFQVVVALEVFIILTVVMLQVLFHLFA